MRDLMAIGVYLWGALYTAGVFLAALLLGSHLALCLALASAGFAYCAQFAGFTIYTDGVDPVMARRAWQANVACTAISVVAGIVGGLVILIAT